MTDTPTDPLAILAQLRVELGEIQQGLDLQHRLAEAAGDGQRALQVHSTRSHLQSAEALIDQFEEALFEPRGD